MSCTLIFDNSGFQTLTCCKATEYIVVILIVTRYQDGTNLRSQLMTMTTTPSTFRLRVVIQKIHILLKAQKERDKHHKSSRTHHTKTFITHLGQISLYQINYNQLPQTTQIWCYKWQKEDVVAQVYCHHYNYTISHKRQSKLVFFDGMLMDQWYT